MIDVDLISPAEPPWTPTADRGPAFRLIYFAHGNDVDAVITASSS